MLEWVAGREADGIRLDLAVARHVEVGSRAVAQRLIAEGRVEVDGRRRAKGHRLSSGERVAVRFDPSDGGPMTPDDERAAGDVSYGVLFEDSWLVVVDKPAGVVVHPSAGHASGTLAQALAGRAAGGDERARPGIVHRLDRDTSGLLVVAKDPEAHRRLQDLIRSRAVAREYLGLVEGRTESLSGTIDAPLGRDRTRRTAVSTRTDRPRSARTHFEQLEALPLTTHLRIHLETGRTHQIRAHMQAIGHAICGDPLYGGEECGRRLGLARQFLHSHRLGFVHPMTGEAVDCRSPLPPDLRAALAVARTEDA
jgi:23S rRNA pseudouridine1911/1915/1917 synthase